MPYRTCVEVKHFSDKIVRFIKAKNKGKIIFKFKGGRKIFLFRSFTFTRIRHKIEEVTCTT